MTNIQNMWRNFLPAIIVTAAMLTPVTMASEPDKGKGSAQNNGKQQEGQGKYGQLTAQWWQWTLERPFTDNPIIDETGEDAANGQPREDVFFLAGNFGGETVREFTVPANTALFLPLLNSLGFAPKPAPQPKPNENQVPQLRTPYAAPFIDSATELHVTLDNVSLLDSVIGSSPRSSKSSLQTSSAEPSRRCRMATGCSLSLCHLAPMCSTSVARRTASRWTSQIPSPWSKG